jgi:hypothetical protein
MKKKVTKKKKFSKKKIFFFFEVVIKCEPALDTSEIENKNNESGQKVVVRIPRIECNKK